MTSRIKIFIIIAVIIAVLAVVLALSRDIKNSEAPKTAPPELIVEVFTPEQKKSIEEFVKNFLSLYNTYAYEDYANLSALGDYQTQNAQKQTLERINQLGKNTPQGFRRTADLKDANIEVRSLLFPPNQIEARAKFWIKEQIIGSLESTPRSDDSVEAKEYQAVAILKLVPYNRSWLVDDYSE